MAQKHKCANLALKGYALGLRAWLLIILLLLQASTPASGQIQQAPPHLIFHMVSANTAFPDTGRANGHIYDSVWYGPSEHYSDNAVLVLIPPGTNLGAKTDLVFWFHGWRNNIDTALMYYHLGEQFLGSGKNAVLVMAETAKNAPDSYGGKLEQGGVFAALVQDIYLELKKRKLCTVDFSADHILLAGHSGAYRVIAQILKNGGMPVAEVDLFDALYGETDIFQQWILSNPAHRFINWYTNQGGGTDEVSIAMMGQLEKANLPFIFSEEPKLDKQLLAANRIVFVHSSRPHNDIIFSPDNFRLLLEASPILSPAR